MAWGGKESGAHQLVTGVPQGSVLGPLLFSIYTTSLAPIIKAHGISYHCYADDTQLYFSFRPDDPTVSTWISGCLADISAWMKKHHLQLNLAKTELLVFPATPTPQHDFSIQIDSSTITPSSSVRNLGVIFDDQLPFKNHIAKFCSEQCLKCCMTSTPCDCLPLYNVSLIVFLNSKSLWTKASAKWINVNVSLLSYLSASTQLTLNCITKLLSADRHGTQR